MTAETTDHPVEIVDLEVGEVPSDVWQQTFRIDGDRTAQWAMRHLAELRADEARDTATYDAELAHLDEWATRRAKSREWGISFFERHLEDYARRQREATGGKRKSIDLPAGKVRTTIRKARIVVTDRDSFVEWATGTAASLLRVKREPDATAIGVALQMTDSGTVVDPVSGEVVPGLGVEPESVSVSIKPGTST